MNYLTKDDVRVIKSHIEILSYEIDSYEEEIIEGKRTSYVKEFKPIFYESIKDTILSMYSIIKDTEKGGNDFGLL